MNVHRSSSFFDRQINSNDDRASECSSTTSSKPPVYPLTPTGQTRQGYTTIGLRQRELRSKLHKTRYAQSLRQTNGSPTMYDSPSSRRTPIPSPHIPMVNFVFLIWERFREIILATIAIEKQ